jgi:hypothetical protein
LYFTSFHHFSVKTSYYAIYCYPRSEIFEHWSVNSVSTWKLLRCGTDMANTQIINMHSHKPPSNLCYRCFWLLPTTVAYILILLHYLSRILSRMYVYDRGGPHSALALRQFLIYCGFPLISPLLIPHFEWSAGRYLWERHRGHLVPWKTGPGHEILSEL